MRRTVLRASSGAVKDTSLANDSDECRVVHQNKTAGPAKLRQNRKRKPGNAASAPAPGAVSSSTGVGPGEFSTGDCFDDTDLRIPGQKEPDGRRRSRVRRSRRPASIRFIQRQAGKHGGARGRLLVIVTGRSGVSLDEHLKAPQASRRAGATYDTSRWRSRRRPPCMDRFLLAAGDGARHRALPAARRLLG